MPNSDFTGANLGEAQAGQSDFQGSNFSQAQLVSINMPGAVLDGIHGKGVQACNAVLDFSSFRGADLPAINLADASLLSTDWTNAKLLAANLYNVQAMRCRMANVFGQRAKFSNADLRWSSISGNFAFANFQGAVLTGVTLSGDLHLAGALFEQARGVGPDTNTDAVLRFLHGRTEEVKVVASNRPTAMPTR
jgi:uncharacterized protein YjbI with pentapeptide repeats